MQSSGSRGCSCDYAGSGDGSYSMLELCLSESTFRVGSALVVLGGMANTFKSLMESITKATQGNTILVPR